MWILQSSHRHLEGSSSEDEGKQETDLGPKKKSVMCDPKGNNKDESTGHTDVMHGYIVDCNNLTVSSCPPIHPLFTAG